MAKIKVKTGFGYIKNKDGEVIAKCKLSQGKHPFKPGYTYVEVDTQKELDGIEIYIAPEDLKKGLINQEKQKILEENAIQSLIDRGVLDAAGNLKKNGA